MNYERPTIYAQHEAAFANVSAYVVLKNGERVATIAFKFPKDGAGRLYCYLHVIGVQMVRGHANGHGYDKRSAAAVSAAKAVNWDSSALDRTPDDVALNCHDIKAALKHDDGYSWDRHLENAGFTVLQAV